MEAWTATAQEGTLIRATVKRLKGLMMARIDGVGVVLEVG